MSALRANPAGKLHYEGASLRGGKDIGGKRAKEEEGRDRCTEMGTLQDRYGCGTSPAGVRLDLREKRAARSGFQEGSL